MRDVTRRGLLATSGLAVVGAAADSAFARHRWRWRPRPTPTPTPVPTVTPTPSPDPGGLTYPTPPVGSTVVKSLDWEDGQVKNTSTWSGGTTFYSGASTDNSPNARMQVVDAAGPTVTGIPTPASPGVVPQGVRCLYCEVRQGDALIADGPRSQISGGYLQNGHEYLWCFRWRMPSTSSYPADTGGQYFLIVELHTANGGSPPVALFIDGGQPTPKLWLGNGAGTPGYWSGTGAVDQWHAAAIRWNQSTSGWIEFWYDGAWQTMAAGKAGPNGVSRVTANVNNGSSLGLYPMLGIYQGGGTGHVGTYEMYHDDHRIYRIA
jgi:hypothetical protein